MIELIPLFAAVTPFILWPIEIIIPAPYIIEEIAKLILIFPLLAEKSVARKIRFTILIGMIFAFSEAVLYLFNISLVGNIGTFFERLMFTIPLHTLTALTILIPSLYGKRLVFAGLIAAIIIHYFYNVLIASI